MANNNQKKIIDALNQALENEYAGVIRYSHYSLMIFGFNRIPIVQWFREQSKESLTHAEMIGEWITSLGDHPSLKISGLLETHKHDLRDILGESLEHEKAQIELLGNILELLSTQQRSPKLVATKQVALEEFIRTMIEGETAHIHEIEKMLRQQK